MAVRDPLADPTPLIRRVYAYVAYRIGDGPDAEDVTSTTIERALRYRSSYDAAKGAPVNWLLGIARSCVDDHFRCQHVPAPMEVDDVATDGDLEASTVQRLAVAKAISVLDERDRELVALRYGADLGSREIGRLLGMSVSAVDVALHRCRERLRGELEGAGTVAARPPGAVTRDAARQAT